MKDLIKGLVRQKLNEVAQTCHYLARREDRVWGDGESKGVPAASINADAYTGQDVAATLDLKSCDDKTKREYVKNNIPITKYAKTILDKLEILENQIDFKTKYGLGIIFWKSKVVHKGGTGWGNNLLAVMLNNKLVTLQWQPGKDVNVHGGKVVGAHMIFTFEQIYDYVKKTGVTTLTDEDLNKLNKGDGEDEPKTDKELIVKLAGSRYLVDKETGDLTHKNNGKVTKFDSLPDDTQEKIFDLIS